MMRLKVAFIALFMLSPVSVSAQPEQTYSAEQFYASTSYSLGSSNGYPFTPDGENILVNSDASGVFNAYLQPIGGGEPVMLTQSTTNASFGVSFFPEDMRLLFSADEGGNELNHIYVRAQDGTITDLTPGNPVKAQFMRWSADNTRFFVMTNERDAAAFDIYAYDADDYGRELVFTNPGKFLPSDITPDGRWVAMSRDNSSADSDIYLADLATTGATPVLITAHEGNVSHEIFGFTPDSASLFYGTDAYGEFSQVWTHDLAGGTKEVLLKADWDAMAWPSPTGRHRVEVINADGSSQLAIRTVDGGQSVSLNDLPEGDIANVRFTPDERTIAFRLTTDTSPADIYVADLATGNARRLTHALNPEIDESDLVDATVARFASYDGVQVPGILYRPQGANADSPAPAVVLVHGGPGGQSRRGYSPIIQHLVNHGYAVYAINNRGSSGYGKTFYHMDDKRHGDADLRDVVASKEFLQGLDWVADDRIAIMGGSYGGYMTAAALAFHPEVFDAGINIFGVTNWLRTLKSIPAWWGPMRDSLYDELGNPDTDEERLRAISPLFHADQIERPMLVVQGANDPRVLQVESDELVAAARANGAPVEYIVFPDEGHGFMRRENRVTASEAYLAFLNEHVGTDNAR